MSIGKLFNRITGKTARMARDEELEIIWKQEAFKDQIAKLIGISDYRQGKRLGLGVIGDLEEKTSDELLELCQSYVFSKKAEIEIDRRKVSGFHDELYACRADYALDWFRILREFGFIESGELYLGNVKHYKTVSAENYSKFMAVTIANGSADYGEHGIIANRMLDLLTRNLENVESIFLNREQRDIFILKARARKLLKALIAYEFSDGRDLFYSNFFNEFVAHYDALSFYPNSFSEAYNKCRLDTGIVKQRFDWNDWRDV
jgi:hypothetical protein